MGFSFEEKALQTCQLTPNFELKLIQVEKKQQNKIAVNLMRNFRQDKTPCVKKITICCFTRRKKTPTPFFFLSWLKAHQRVSYFFVCESVYTSMYKLSQLVERLRGKN